MSILGLEEQSHHPLIRGRIDFVTANCIVAFPHSNQDLMVTSIGT